MENRDANQIAEEINAATKRASTHRTIESMPVVLSYLAHIEPVTEQEVRGEQVFSNRTWSAVTANRPHRWSEELRDPHEVRAEFEQVATPRQALDFLRHNGQFSPISNDISWAVFQRWQAFVAIARDTDAFARAFMNNEPSTDVREVHKALVGLPHMFFPEPLIVETELEKKWMENPEVAAGVSRGRLHKQAAERELESWFIKPPVEITWHPKVFSGATVELLSRGGALPELVLPRVDLRPILLIRASHVLTAIAASIYADRVAQVGFKICPFCKARFELTGPTDKREYDRNSCREAAKKARFRKETKRRSAALPS